MNLAFTIAAISISGLVAMHWTWRRLNDYRPRATPSRRQIRRWRKDRVLTVAPNRRRS